MRHLPKIFCCCLPILIFLSLSFLRSQQTPDDAPGPLSPAHKDSPGLKNCDRCHNDDLEIAAQKCLECHEELFSRITANRGFHRDKSGDCAVCHTEHEGEETKLVDWDVSGFDHEETGYLLLGKHKTVDDCLKCHKKENSIPRKTSFSYLIKDSRCIACHAPRHPGQQDDCEVCHGPQNWRVEIWRRPIR